MIPIKKVSLCISFCFLFLNAIAENKWKYNSRFNFGCNVNLYHGKGQHFPGFKFYCAFIFNGNYNTHLITNYGVALSVYRKSLGNNLNPLTNDTQIDLSNSFSIGGGGDENSFFKYYRTIQTAPYYNGMIKNNYAALLTTNFVINNHKRNQATGCITASFPGATVNYMNDGAIPMSTVGIGDGFDRWWTGSGGIYIHSRDEYNFGELTFDQFTGYSSLLYELSGVLGINVPSYNLRERSVSDDEKNLPPFNASAYTLRVFPVKGYAIETGVLGSLRSNKGRIWGMQDLIHLKLGYSFHPNFDVNRFFLGVTTNNMSYVKI